MIDLRWPTRMHSNGRPCRGQWLLAGWHPAWSITWVWALYWQTSTRFVARFWRNRNGGGSASIGVPLLGTLSFKWQRSMRRRAS